MMFSNKEVPGYLLTAVFTGTVESQTNWMAKAWVRVEQMEIVHLDRSLSNLALKEKKECDSEEGYLFVFKGWSNLDGKELVKEKFQESWVTGDGWNVEIPKKAGRSGIQNTEGGLALDRNNQREEFWSFEFCDGKVRDFSIWWVLLYLWSRISGHLLTMKGGFEVEILRKVEFCNRYSYIVAQKGKTK